MFIISNYSEKQLNFNNNLTTPTRHSLHYFAYLAHTLFNTTKESKRESGIGVNRGLNMGPNRPKSGQMGLNFTESQIVKITDDEEQLGILGA